MRKAKVAREVSLQNANAFLSRWLLWEQVRVTNLKGLTVASQIKYVHLFERVWREVR